MPDAYRKSPTKFHSPEYYWREISDETKKLLYRFYFLDFLIIGYDFDSFRKFLNGPNVKPPEHQLRKAANEAAEMKYATRRNTKRDSYFTCLNNNST